MAVESNGGGGRHPNWALFGVGTGVFVVGWLATGIITTVVCNNVGCQNSEAALSFVPVFGPPSILALSADGMEAGQIAGLLVGETVQLTGIVLSIVGLVTTVESNAARNQSPLRMGELPFVVTPVTGSGFTGFSAVGQF